MIRRKSPIHRCLLFLVVLGCSGTEEQEVTEKKVRVEFINQSQFSLESLYLHDQALNYQGQTNLLKEPLTPGESISDVIPARLWYVTVYRRPNQDSDILAYTTATVWDASKYPAIIYFDEQFRVSVSP